MTISILRGRRILLGVTGSIACYKVVDLASTLTQAGALVDVIMTEAAQRFVQPVTFRSVTGRSVHTDMWSLDEHVRHVQLGEEADLLLVAPATAHTLAKLAHGEADNLLTVTALAARCPVAVAPAMDGGMYEHPAVQANVATLRERGVTVLGPAEGRMASGLTGTGRLVEPPELLQHLRLILGQDGPLRDRHVVVTAGPTEEPLDPVRFMTNRSTGKQGLALAQAALDLGARVTLITGPIREPLPLGVESVHVRTAAQMRDAVLEAAAGADVLLMVAAVADFRPAHVAGSKIKKDNVVAEQPVIELARNPDILMAVRRQREEGGRPLVTMGFAAETEDAVSHGRGKLARKGLDFIAINDVAAADAGFAVDTNQITLIERDGAAYEFPLQRKSAVAEELLRHVLRRLHAI
jgi:phosphopantothenoylcysteine decarboxylase/phosphopantothenate--cysteine ligase